VEEKEAAATAPTAAPSNADHRTAALINADHRNAAPPPRTDLGLEFLGLVY
jgi:hypothetical protein